MYNCKLSFTQKMSIHFYYLFGPRRLSVGFFCLEYKY